ncbi:MAG: efflux RND transporter periplasmic adaptor subunit [Methylomonas sp.]|nr:efflux RND transporter periplasmic adaptor subunit [Methylomonas sp.]
MSEHNSISTHGWLLPSAAIGVLLLVILFALGILGGPDKIEPGTSPAQELSLPAGARTVVVGRQAAANVLSWQGTVRSRTVAKIAPKLNARILDVLVHPGDSVKKGDVLARLDDRDLRAAYDAAAAAQIAAQAQADQAGADETRMIDLYRKQAATRQNYDAAVAQAKAARAMVSQAASAAQQAKVMLGENVLYAPFDGVISERLKEPGDMAMPGEGVVLMHKPDALRLEAAIASQCSEQIRSGMPVNVRLDALQQTVSARVDEVAPEIDPSTHTRMIKAELPAIAGLRHGQFGWLELSCQAERQTTLIPVTAVLQFGQLQAVKVLDGQQLHTRHIRTGKRYGDQVQVLSGLHGGETIVSDSGLAP